MPSIKKNPRCNVTFKPLPFLEGGSGLSVTSPLFWQSWFSHTCLMVNQLCSRAHNTIRANLSEFCCPKVPHHAGDTYVLCILFRVFDPIQAPMPGWWLALGTQAWLLAVNLDCLRLKEIRFRRNRTRPAARSAAAYARLLSRPRSRPARTEGEGLGSGNGSGRGRDGMSH